MFMSFRKIAIFDYSSWEYTSLYTILVHKWRDNINDLIDKSVHVMKILRF